MNNLLYLFLLVITCNSCFSQQNFDKFVEKFKLLNLPAEDITQLTSENTLDAKITNDIIIRSQKVNPRYIDKDGNLNTIEQYYGLYPEKPFEYGYKGKKEVFNTKIFPVGRINLNINYISLVIKVVAYETTFYDLWNFSKDGKALSVLCLFWGMRDAGPRDEKVTYTIVSSKVLKDCNIIWHENNDGLETFRTYKLNNDGLFQIVREEKKGEVKD